MATEKPIDLDQGQGLSKLDERLGAYRDPESGHIMISQETALREIVIPLLGFYRKMTTVSPIPGAGLPGHQPSSKIEALAAIFQGSVPASREGPLYDYDLIKEGIDLKRIYEQSRQQEEIGKGQISTDSGRSSQREI